MIIDLVSFDDLRDSFPRLYRTVSKFFGYTSGTYAVDLAKLSDFTRGELSAWIRTQREKKPPAPQPVAEPVAPVVVKREEPEVIRELMDVSKNEERRRVALLLDQQARDEDAFEARLEEWGRSGLETTQENANAIVDWIKQNPQLKGYFSAQAADLAVAWLGPKGSNALTWKPQAEVPPLVESAEPTEILEPLPNREPRLPLDVDNATLRRASKEQAKDYLARVNAGKLVRPRGGFGSSF